eukprot:2085903-Pleurochrysis_carterae.AAC.1
MRARGHARGRHAQALPRGCVQGQNGASRGQCARRAHLRPDLEAALRALPNVQDVRAELLDVVNLELSSVARGDHANVADLPAGLGVEGGAREHEPDQSGVRVNSVDPLLAVVDGGGDGGVDRHALAHARPLVLGRVVCRCDVHLVAQRVGLLGEQLDRLQVAKVASIARLLSRRFHLGLVALLVHAQPLLLAHEQRQVDREAVRVVHAEGILA